MQKINIQLLMLFINQNILRRLADIWNMTTDGSAILNVSFENRNNSNGSVNDGLFKDLYFIYNL